MAAKRTSRKGKSAKLKEVLNKMKSEDIEEPMDEEAEEKMTDAEKMLKEAADIADGDIDEDGFIEIRVKGKWTRARVCKIEYDGDEPIYNLSVVDEFGDLPNKINMKEKVKNLEIRATNSVLSEFDVQRKKDPKTWARFEKVKTKDGWTTNVIRGMLNVLLFTPPFALSCTLTNIYKHTRKRKRGVYGAKDTI